MAQQGYGDAEGVMTLEEAANLDAINAANLDTKGRYKPHGVYYRGDRVTEHDDDDPYIYQELRRKLFDSGQLRVGPGTNRVCSNDEEEIFEHPMNRQRYCLKPCKQGQMRNWNTNRCFNVDAVRRRRFKCRPGYLRNEQTDRCKKVRNIFVQPDQGYDIDDLEGVIVDAEPGLEGQQFEFQQEGDAIQGEFVGEDEEDLGDALAELYVGEGDGLDFAELAGQIE
jgi:hypothetical protein